MEERKSNLEVLFNEKAGTIYVKVLKNTNTGKKFAQLSRKTKDINGNPKWNNFPLFSNDNLFLLSDLLKHADKELKGGLNE